MSTWAGPELQAAGELSDELLCSSRKRGGRLRSVIYLGCYNMKKLVSLSFVAASFATFYFVRPVLADEVHVIDTENDVAVSADDHGNVVVQDGDGNSVAKDSEGNIHVEDEDGNYVKLDKHGNVREVEDEDGNSVSLDKHGNVTDVSTSDE